MRKIKTHFFIVLFLAVISFGVSAFASTTVKISPSPAYNPTEPIPLEAGIVVSEGPGVQSHGKSQINRPYGPMVVDELKKMKVFSGIIYPYKAGSPADIVLRLSIKGRWDYYSQELQPRDYWSGTTGARYAKGTHDVKVVLMAKDKEIMGGSLPVKSTGQYYGSDYDLITNKLNEAQTKNIAVAVAKLIQDNRRVIMAKVLNKPAEAGVPASSSSAVAGAEEISKTPGVGGTGSQRQKNADKLKALEELHASGVLSDEDFNKAKTRLIQMQKLEDLYKSGVLSEQEYKRGLSRISGESRITGK